MTFEELLASLPKSDLETWRKAATRQLKGRELDSINVDIGGVFLPPYAQPGGPAPSVGGSGLWTIVSDVRADVAPIIEELDGGAQGLLVEASQLQALAHQGEGIRYDFIHTFIANMERDELQRLLACIPAEQRADANVVLQTEPAQAYQLWAEAERAGLASAHVLCAASSSSPGLAEELLTLLRELKTILSNCGDELRLAEFASNIYAQVAVAADYPSTLVKLRAVRLLYANLLHGFTCREPLPPLKLLAVIAPQPEQTAEHYLIDATVRVVAAATAGVDAICVSARNPLERSRVRKLQHVLAIEAGFAGAGEVLRGAAFVEQAAHKLAEQVWEHFAAEV